MESLLELPQNLNILFHVDCLSSGNPVHVDHASAVKKRIIECLWVCLFCLTFLGLGEPACFHWELCLLVSRSLQQIQLSLQVTRASRTAESELVSSTISLLSWQHLSFWSSLRILGTNFAQIFRIFSSSWIIVCTVPTLTSNYAPNISIDKRRSLSMKFFIWPINSGVLTSLPLTHLSSSLTDSLPSFNLSKTGARFMQDGQKTIWCIPYVFVPFFPNLKQNFIAHHSSEVSSRPDSIFEIHQLWQSGFSRVYSNWCCSCLFKPEIIKIDQSSHKMYNNNILNFQEAMKILNACRKKVWKLIEWSSFMSEFLWWSLARFIS